MIIDCQSCVVRDIACGDCVVGSFLGLSDDMGAGIVELAPAETRALRVLHGAGLVPDLHMSSEARTGTA